MSLKSDGFQTKMPATRAILIVTKIGADSRIFMSRHAYSIQKQFFGPNCEAERAT